MHSCLSRILTHGECLLALVCMVAESSRDISCMTCILDRLQIHSRAHMRPRCQMPVSAAVLLTHWSLLYHAGLPSLGSHHRSKQSPGEQPRPGQHQPPRPGAASSQHRHCQRVPSFLPHDHLRPGRCSLHQSEVVSQPCLCRPKAKGASPIPICQLRTSRCSQAPTVVAALARHDAWVTGCNSQ